MNAEDMGIPVFILCGGQGTRLKEETEFRPKPMVTIGPYPIVWHIMWWYAQFGFRRFVLCLGYKGEMIKEYFLNYASLNSDFTVNLKTNDVEVHSVDHDQDWTVTLAATGETAMTGARVARAAARYLPDTVEHFAVTYGDGLTDAPLMDEFQFHVDHGKIGTVLGVNPPSRFGEFRLQHDDVLAFDEKPDFLDKWINGGFFFFRRDFLKYLSSEDSCILERQPLVDLAGCGQLCVYKHSGFWGCMDTQRDRDELNKLWNSGSAPWSPC